MNKINLTKEQWQQIELEKLNFNYSDYHWLILKTNYLNKAVDLLLNISPTENEHYYYYHILIQIYKQYYILKQVYKNNKTLIGSLKKHIHLKIWNKIKNANLKDSHLLTLLLKKDYDNLEIWEYIKKNNIDNKVLFDLIAYSKKFHNEAYNLFLQTNYTQENLYTLFIHLDYKKENYKIYLEKIWNLFKEKNISEPYLYWIYKKTNNEKINNECFEMLNKSLLGKCYLEHTFNKNWNELILKHKLTNNDIFLIFNSYHLNYNIEIANWLKQQTFIENDTLENIILNSDYHKEAWEILKKQNPSLYILKCINNYSIHYHKEAFNLYINSIINQKKYYLFDIFNNYGFSTKKEILDYSLNYKKELWELLKKENLNVIELIRIYFVKQYNKETDKSEPIFCQKEIEEMLSKLDLRLIDKLKMQHGL